VGKNASFLEQYKIGYRLTFAVLTRTYLDLNMDVQDLAPHDVFYPLPWWRSQSLGTSLEQTRIDFPAAVCTHFGYSTNRLSDATSTSAASEDAASEIDGKTIAAALTERQYEQWQAAIAAIETQRQNVDQAVPATVTSFLQSSAFAALCSRTVFRYDTKRHPLREAFLSAVGCAGLELERWHCSLCGFSAEEPAKTLQHKAHFLSPLREENQRAGFETAYHDFVCDVVAPSLAATLAREGVEMPGLYYAAFPCVRIAPPSKNWTIRPHADFMYGHPAGSINIWLPFTHVSGSNTLFAESTPSHGDFRPMDLKYGQLCRWYGTHCTHFTLPNTSDVTRVSLDFRVVPSCSYSPNQASSYEVGEYYAVCIADAQGRWRCTTPGRVSEQHGFPFHMPKMKYY